MVFVTLLVSACDEGTAEPSGFTQRIAFYGSDAGVPRPVTVTVDGNQVGTITGIWPSGPGNCSAEYTVTMTVTDIKSHDWNAKAANGIAFSGTFSATPGTANGCKIIRAF